MNSVPANLLKNFWISFTVASLLILSTSQLMIQYGDFANAKLLSRFCFVLLCVCIAPLFQLREWILVLVSFALLMGLYPTQTGQFDILFALDKAAFFAAFIYLVTLLKEAAVRSNSVLKLGTYLTQQPSGRRYFSIAFGGHILGVLLNFGAISLLMPLIQRGTKTAKTPAHSAILEQQQISALLRGFSWMIMWSPTALTQAVLFTAFPQIDLTLIISLGIGSTLVMILLGRIEDRIRWRNTKLPVDTKQQAFPSRSAVRFSVICISLIGFTVSVVVIANVSAAIALMLVAPFVMTLWLFAQQYDKHVVNALKGTAKTLTTIFKNARSERCNVGSCGLYWRGSGTACAG